MEIKIGNIIITIRSPIKIEPSWKVNMKYYAKQGKNINALKSIKEGKNISLKKAYNIWNEKYRNKYSKKEV